MEIEEYEIKKVDRRIQRYKKNPSDVCRLRMLVHTYKKNIESPPSHSSKHDREYMAFECLDDGICNFNGYREESFESAFDDIQFADGAPFGVKVEQ